MKKFRVLALAAGLLLPLAALADKVPLVDPDPIVVPPNITQDSVFAAVMQGVTARHWKSIPSTTPGVLHASIAAHGGDRASVDVVYDTSKVQIHYVGSENMGEETVNGQRVINSRYVNWSRNLAQSIDEALNPPKK